MRGIGFSSFLSLNISKISTRLGLYLIEKFNTKNCKKIKLETDELYIDEEDINLTLGILCRPKQVTSLSMYEDSFEEYIGLIEDMRTRYGTLLLELSTMPEIILNKKEAGDEFKQDIVMYIVSSVLHYPQARKCHSRLIKNLKDTKDIKNYNHC